MGAFQKPPAKRSFQKRLGWRFFVFGGPVLAGLFAASFWGVRQFAEWRGSFCERQQQLLLASKWQNTAARWGADSAVFWLAKAQVDRKLARDADFLNDLKRAQARGASTRRLELETLLAEAQRGQLSRLRQQLSQVLLQGAPGDEVCNAYVEGCLISYKLDDAAELLKNWSADFPQDGRPHFLRGRILEHRTNLSAARDAFQRALDLQPTYAAAAYNLARTLVTEQKPAEAIPYYRSCARYLGTPVPGLVGEARCLRILRRYDEAISLLAVAERSNSEEAAQGFRLVGESKEAAESELLAERGRLAADREDHSQAVVCLEEAIAKSPLDWRIRYQLALSQRQVGKLSEARENMERVDETKEALATCDRLFDVLKNEPANVPARLQIGKVFLRYVSENQGLVWLNSVLELDGSNVEAHRLTAEYLESHLDEHPEYAELAKKHRERVRRANPVSGTKGE